MDTSKIGSGAKGLKRTRKVFTCREGHQWEISINSTDGNVLQTVNCPICGAEASPSSVTHLPQADVETFTQQQPPPKPYNDWITVPGFEILGELGRGGMGVVYKARQLNLRRVVALKVLNSDNVGPKQAVQWQAEAEAVARLRNPNIVSIYDIGVVDKNYYLSLEFVEGGSLAQKAAGVPMAPEKAASIIETLARAIQCMHLRGVVHRDLKPGNVLLTSDGMPKITDFGLAKRLEEDAPTEEAAIMGTPSYMSPEQADGRVRDIGPVTDVYALGAILYELLTGKPPFKGETIIDTLEHVKTAPPIHPAQIIPNVPADLSAICLKCLEKDPAKRYSSAEALAEDLHRYLADEPILARRTCLRERVLKWTRRRPALAVLTTVCILLAVVGFAGILSQWREAHEQRKIAEKEMRIADEQRTIAQEEKLEADKARKSAEEHSQTANLALAFNRVALADREWTSNNAARAENLLESCPPNLRYWEWNYLNRLFHSHVFRMETDKGYINGVAFNHDGSLLAVAVGDYRKKGEVRIRDLDKGERSCVLKDNPAKITCVAFSPDKKFLACGSQSSVAFWNIEVKSPAKPEFALQGFKNEVTGVAFSKDGKFLATASKDHYVKVWDVDGKKVVASKEFDGDVNGAAFSHDGGKIALACNDNNAYIWDWKANESKPEPLADHHGPVTCVAFSADGNLIATGSQDKTVKIWNADNATLRLTIRGHSNWVLGIAFRSDGKELASGSADRTVKVWNTETGEENRTYRGHADRVLCVAYGPDGKLIASGSRDKSFMIWDARSEQAARSIPAGDKVILGLSFANNGKKLASASDDKRVKIWSMPDGKELAAFPHGERVNAVAFSPTEDRVATVGDEPIVRIWDVGTEKAIHSLVGHKGPVLAVAYSPDGKQLATGGTGKTVKIWDSQDGKLLHTLRDHIDKIHAIVYSRDGKQLASAGEDKKIRIWNPIDGKLLRTIDAHSERINALAFDNTGDRLASGSADDTVKIWDLKTGNFLRTCRGNTKDVLCVAFTPDNKSIVAGSGDLGVFVEPGTVRFWDAQTGQETLTLRGHDGPVYGLAFSPDGHILATASGDKTIRLWDATPHSDTELR